MVGIIFTYNLPKQKIPSCSLFVHPQLNKHYFFFHWDGETGNNADSKFGWTNKEYYGIFCFSQFQFFNPLKALFVHTF